MCYRFLVLIIFVSQFLLLPFLIQNKRFSNVTSFSRKTGFDSLHSALGHFFEIKFILLISRSMKKKKLSSNKRKKILWDLQLDCLFPYNMMKVTVDELICTIILFFKNGHEEQFTQKYTVFKKLWYLESSPKCFRWIIRLACGKSNNVIVYYNYLFLGKYYTDYCEYIGCPV